MAKRILAIGLDIPAGRTVMTTCHCCGNVTEWFGDKYPFCVDCDNNDHDIMGVGMCIRTDSEYTSPTPINLTAKLV